MRIAIVTSTRADWGLLMPLARQLQNDSRCQLQIIATNMHLMPEYGHTVNEIIESGFCLDACVPMTVDSSTEAARVRAMAQCLSGMADAFTKLQPDMIVILGDRYEMLAVASAASVMKIPIAHLHGGETSEGAIDDNLRHAITKLSSLHFTSTEAYRQRVIQMGEMPERVINAGAPGVWNIKHHPLLSHKELQDSLGFEFEPGRLLLATFHPATLDGSDSGERCREMLRALDQFPEYKVIITYPNNDAGSEEIIHAITVYQSSRTKVVKSLGLTRYLSALSMAAAQVGNSSSGIIEAPSLGIPSVDIGIRQKGRIAAESVIHCGDSAEEIAAAIAKAITPEFQNKARECHNPYFRPDTIETISNAILSSSPESLIHKRFCDLT